MLPIFKEFRTKQAPAIQAQPPPLQNNVRGKLHKAQTLPETRQSLAGTIPYIQAMLRVSTEEVKRKESGAIFHLEEQMLDDYSHVAWKKKPK